MATLFGAWLKAELDRRGWSQRNFASQVGISQNAVQKHIKGDHEPDRATVVRYANYLGVDPNGALVASGFTVEYVAPDESERTRIGQRIRTHRESKGLSQEQVAVKLGVDRHTYRAWEIGTTDMIETGRLVPVQQVVMATLPWSYCQMVNQVGYSLLWQPYPPRLPAFPRPDQHTPLLQVHITDPDVHDLISPQGTVGQ